MSNNENSTTPVLRVLRCLLRIADAVGKTSAVKLIGDLIVKIEVSGVSEEDVKAIDSLIQEVFDGIKASDKTESESARSKLFIAYRDFVKSMRDPDVVRIIAIEIAIKLAIHFLV